MSASWPLLTPVAALVLIVLGAIAVLRLQKVPLGRQSADLPGSVSVLRVCDVVLWMHHRTDYQQGNCIGT